MAKSLQDQMDKIHFHLLKADELTREWWKAREDMGRSMMTMDESTDFFIDVATSAIKTERDYINKIRFHRMKAKRLMRRYEDKYNNETVELPQPDMTQTINNVYVGANQ